MRGDEQLRPDGHELRAIHAGLGPRHAFPHDRAVLDLVLDRVADAPGRPAIRYRDRTMTYADLDAESNVTANRLLAAGDVMRRLVPVLATDGPEFPVSLIGVMKAGAAFVPLDPAWPADRLGTILHELNPPAIVATPGTDVDFDGPVVPVGDEWDVSEAAPVDAALRPGPADLIYGFYTSGSTGTPKCALNHHRGLVNRLTTMSRRFGDGSGHVTLQNSRSTFDSSMWQVLWPLVSGGQVVLPHRDGILDLEQTAATIGRYGVTITDFVPSVLAAFVSLLELRHDLRDAVSPSLRRMLIGGEEANAAVVHRLRALLPNLRVTNTFGPTECSIGSVFHEITDEDAERIPLGGAIDNTAAVVLDENMRPVPAETVGEIFLGGECVGAGYLNDPGRTAQVFVANPFPQIPGEKLYRTGDLARSDHSGRLFFMGRRDDQVKVGGVRVELGDVASALASHPMVGGALAVVLAESILVGCVTPRTPGVRPSVAQLKQHAAQRLPADSLPHRIIVLDELPLNRNGKADRKAVAALLAAQQREEAASVEHVEPPANPMEELVRAAWGEVLERDQISVVTPFSEYGGTSLTAYRLITAVSSRLGYPVRPRDLLVATTVRAQAKRFTDGAADDGIELAYLARDIAWRPPMSLLLTGATGFIGGHLFADLLTNSNAKLTCLIRCADAQDGVRRLTQALERYRLTHARQLLPVSLKMRRVEVIPGDLDRERLGLSESRYERLATTVTGIVHAAGKVNFLAGYIEHRPSNVLGVQELIKLASNGARVHALSTLSIFPAGETASGNGSLIRETQLPDPDRVATDGYNRSKYVAERLLATARERGVGSVVYRLGEIWPHRATGVGNAASIAHNVLYACVRAGCVFETAAVTDVTPVDAVSGFVTRCVTGDLKVDDGTVHVLWPSALRFVDAFAALADRYGLEKVSYAEFRQRLEVLAEQPEPDERLVRLRMLLPSPDPHNDAAPEQFDQMFTDCTRSFDTTVYAGDGGDDALTHITRYLTELL